METTFVQASPKLNTSGIDGGITINKNFIITGLLILLILSLLGINLLNIFGSVVQMIGNLFQSIVNVFKPLIIQILSLLGYTTGSVINTTADVVSTTAKTGIDIASGTIHSVGNVLKDGSKNAINQDSKHQFDNSLNLSNLPVSIPNADNADSNIQSAISSGKNQWCLVGNFQGRRGCVEVDKDTKCMSGQIFPSQHLCLNPNLSNNMQ